MGEDKREESWRKLLEQDRENSRKRREQDRYLEALARANRGEDPFPGLKSRSGTQTSELTKENERLRAELVEERAKRTEAEDLLKKERLDPASRRGIYRTLFAALVAAYGLRTDNEEALASIPGLLVKDAEEEGSSLDVKTARRHVRAAFQQHKDDRR